MTELQDKLKEVLGTLNAYHNNWIEPYDHNHVVHLQALRMDLERRIKEESV